MGNRVNIGERTFENEKTMAHEVTPKLGKPLIYLAEITIIMGCDEPIG